MQIVMLIGRVVGEPKECVRRGQRVLVFRVAAENTPLDGDCTTAEYEVSSGRFQMKGEIAAGSEVFVLGPLALGQGLVPYALVQAFAVKVVGLDERARMEIVMDYLSEGITAKDIW